MSAYGTRPETTVVKRGIGGNEGQGVQRDVVYAKGWIPPFTDGRHCGRGILIKLTDLVEGEAAEWQVSASFPKGSK